MNTYYSEKVKENMSKIWCGNDIMTSNKRGRPHNGDMRYLRKTKAGKYNIQKQVDGKIQSFGTYTLNEAKEERNYLESIEWDYDNMI